MAFVVAVVLALAVGAAAWAYTDPTPAPGLAPIGDGYYLRADAATSWLTMRRDAAAEGIDLQPDGPAAAWRSPADQERMVRERPQFAAPVGQSKHQRGTAVDVDTDEGTNATFQWLTANAHRYGWRRPVQREPWHWEYAP